MQKPEQVGIRVFIRAYGDVPQGSRFRGSHHKDYSRLRSILESPFLGKLTYVHPYPDTVVIILSQSHILIKSPKSLRHADPAMIEGLIGKGPWHLPIAVASASYAETQLFHFQPPMCNRLAIFCIAQN